MPTVNPWRFGGRAKHPKITLHVSDVVVLHVVRAEESLYTTPRGPDGVRVSPSKLFNKATAVIDSAVRVNLARRNAGTLLSNY